MSPAQAWCQPAFNRVPVSMPDTHERSAALREATARVRLGEGPDACGPGRIPARGWGQVLRRCARRVFDHRLLGEAAAVAFYALLAVFPALAWLCY